MTALKSHSLFLKGVLQRQKIRRTAVDPAHRYPSQPPLSEPGPSRPRAPRPDVLSKLNVANYIVEEETVRNDYCEWYGISGEWGSNYVLGAGDSEMCEEYPALKRLVEMKDDLVAQTSHPPLYLQLDSPEPDITPSLPPLSKTIQSALTGNRFDSILITPPEPLDWSYIASLPLRTISADPGFVFLWVGAASEDGLERGRECFAKWGFRRAEDIVWVKTNKGGKQGRQTAGDGRDEGGVFAGQKEHCLMGIRGTVRRSTDSRFVHCNVDTDVMIWEDDGDETETRYPPYLHRLIENFCLGTRRLHLFGDPNTARRGWVTTGSDTLDPASIESTQLFDPSTYSSQVYKCDDGRATLPYNPEIDNLRPKSPVRKPRNLPSNSSTPSLSGPQRGPRQSVPRFNNHVSPMPYQSGMMPGMNMGMGMGGNMDMGGGMMGMNGYGMGMNQTTFGQQPGNSQFDPMLLAQAQAQAHAAIQAQMQMAMMQQMQAQMGMGHMQPGQAMFGGMQAGPYGQYGHFPQPVHGANGAMGDMAGQLGYHTGGAGQQQGDGEVYWQGQGGFYSPGAE